MTMNTVSVYPAYSKRSIPMTEKYYKELIEKASSYNSHLSSERKMRLPFLDSQTGVAQSHSSLWHPYRCRGKGEKGGQLYIYPSKRWKKKKRSIPLPEVRLTLTKLPEVETVEVSDRTLRVTDCPSSTDMHQISAVENPAASTISSKEDSRENMYIEDPYKEQYGYQYYDDWENLSEPLDAGEIDARHSDSSDFEETYIKKKKKKEKKMPKGGRGKKKDPKEVIDDSEKPYSCEQCGARYKTRPGLSYHVSHSHNNAKKKESSVTREREHEAPYQPQVLPFEEEPGSPGLDDSFLSGKTRGGGGRAAAAAASAAVSASVNAQNEASKYCDFCLGDAVENKKTGQKEELVSCADCGRSGHPTCLQFTANMIISVRKYPWQCIECKSCGLCGTSDNDDQLLFCDDCDRGYHMYCLKPPLSEPPEGSWSCHLCIEEFYGGVKPDNGMAGSSMENDTTEL